MFFAINDLEFFIWPSQIYDAQTPVYLWAYHMIGGGGLQQGQVIRLKSTNFELDLAQGADGLVLTRAITRLQSSYLGRLLESEMDVAKQASMREVLDMVFRNKEIDMTSWLAHNVVRGLAQFAFHDYRPAIDYVVGMPVFGGDRKAFYQGW